MPQDAPPTIIDDITVTGQRRTNPTQPFPERPEPPTGPVDPDTPSIDDETGLIDPCARPETAIPWNADAAAAASVGAFRQAAADLGGADAPGGIPNLGQREFGRGLYRNSSGAIVGNAVSWGGPPDEDGVSTFDLNMSGITNLSYIGDAHSHPNGNPLPSQEDWDGFMVNNNLARDPGQRVNDTFYLTSSPSSRTGARAQSMCIKTVHVQRAVPIRLGQRPLDQR